MKTDWSMFAAPFVPILYGRSFFFRIAPESVYSSFNQSHKLLFTFWNSNSLKSIALWLCRLKNNVGPFKPKFYGLPDQFKVMTKNFFKKIVKRISFWKYLLVLSLIYSWNFSLSLRSQNVRSKNKYQFTQFVYVDVNLHLKRLAWAKSKFICEIVVIDFISHVNSFLLAMAKTVARIQPIESFALASIKQ